MADLPQTLIYANLFKDVRAQDVVRLCQESSTLRLGNDCQSPQFWQDMVALYYPDYLQYEPDDIEWVDYFRNLTNDRYVLKNIRILGFGFSKRLFEGKILIDKFVPLNGLYGIYRSKFTQYGVGIKDIVFDFRRDPPQIYTYQPFSQPLVFGRFSVSGYSIITDKEEMEAIYREWLNTPSTLLSVYTNRGM